MIPIKVFKISLAYMIIGTVFVIRLHFTNRHATTNKNLVKTPLEFPAKFILQKMVAFLSFIRVIVF